MLAPTHFSRIICAQLYFRYHHVDLLRQKIPRRPLHMLRLPDAIRSAGLVLRARRRRILPLPLQHALRDEMRRVQLRHPQTIRGDQPEYARRVLAPRMLHDQQGADLARPKITLRTLTPRFTIDSSGT